MNYTMTIDRRFMEHIKIIYKIPFPYPDTSLVNKKRKELK